MGRRQPFSHKQKKAQLQNKRAAKRGDEEAPPHAVAKKPVHRRPGRSDLHGTSSGPRLALESKFVSIPKNYLERTRDIAYSTPLERPLPDEAAVFPLHLVANPAAAGLSVPARPKFRYGQTKKEVEKNEEGVFRKWMAGVKRTVDAWVEDGAWSSARAGEDEGPNGLEWIHSPSWFETNLEVWRQLWRVVEASSILLLLIDSRCVPVHCPPSLRTYLRNLKPRRQIILVLTKADLVDPSALEGWKRWLREWWAAGANDAPPPTRRPPRHADTHAGSPREGTQTPASTAPATPAEDVDDIQIVSVSSYDTVMLHGPGRSRHRPEIPDGARHELVAALKTAHERILEPPQWTQADPEKLAAWKPPVRSTVHWDELEHLDIEAGIKPIGKKAKAEREAAKAAARVSFEDDRDDKDSEGDAPNDGQPPVRDPESEPLTVGLVGQPNVGKSSLLNALLGTTRVRASKTPGKTKHFQTIFWGVRREIKIVDCPGLVCPSLVPMELQAMAGILPISQIPSLPSCIHFAARHMPLEDVFHVPPPEVELDDMEAKKTWRGPRPDTPGATGERTPPKPTWTAGGIMEARALDRGFLTAKGGRPDGNRAGNAMLRTLADGRVRWGFWPPGSRPVRDGRGVWLGAMSEDILNAEGGIEEEQESESESESESGTEGESEGGGEGESGDESGGEGLPRKAKAPKGAAVSAKDYDESEESEDDEEDGFVAANNRSFFAALNLNDNDDDDSDDDDDVAKDEQMLD